MIVLLLEWDEACCFLRLTHDLNLDTLCPDIIEYKLGSRTTLGIYSATKTHFDVFEMLPSLQFIVCLEEVSQIGIYMKLMGVRVGLLSLTELLYFSASYFIVLLEA